MRCKNIKETLVTSIIFVVAVSFMRFYIFFRVMIVRGSISIAPSSMLMCTIGVVWSRGILIISV